MSNKQQNATNWTTTQRKFIEWVALPVELRAERKLEDFAAKVGVRRETLWRWKMLPGFWDEVQAVVKQYMGDTVPEGVATLKEMVRRGSFNHQKMYFEMVGMYTPKIAPVSPDGTKPYSTTSDAEIVSELAGLLAALGARTAAGVDEGSEIAVDDNGPPEAADPPG